MKNTSKHFERENFPDWTLEDFDAIQEDHVFSARYEKAKKAAIRAHKQRRTPTFLVRAAAAAAAVILLPAAVYAAVSHAEFFQNALGNSGRESVASHVETVDDGKGGSLDVTYPTREYVSIDEAMAEDLLGEYTSAEPLVIPVNDHTLTIESAVRDENAIVMEFTIACDTGVTVFDYDELANQAKGPSLSEESTFYFNIDGVAENIYVDLERTTETELHGYYYGLFVFDGPLSDGEAPMLKVRYADMPLLSLPEDASPEVAEYPIDAKKAVALTSFTSEEGGYLELSPLSLKVDMAKGLGLAPDEVLDSLKTIAIEYNDGTVYQVWDDDGNVDNTAYLCMGLGAEDSEYALVFNRLVDPAAISCVRVNGIAYTAG